MQALTREDVLRLNVLLHSNPLAIRIDESAMVVFGLSERGEAKVPLNPNCRDELYLRGVRELISGHVLGSPGGYPVYLKRWTRMGQARDESLDQLLLLGEPEAVVAVVHATGLSQEQARRAWWAMPSAENARCMLSHPSIARGEMGRILAGYLVDYLPFEQEPADIMESVRLVLQSGLVDEETRDVLWRRGRQKTAYYVGFISGVPDALPEPAPPRDDYERLRGRLESMAAQRNPFAAQLLRVFSASGQTYLRTVERAMRKPVNQDVVNTLFDTVAGYFALVRPSGDPEAALERVQQDADALCHGGDADRPCPDSLRTLLETVPELRPDVRAALVLSRLSYGVVRPIFSRTTAIGSLMRRKLEPVIVPILKEIEVLRGVAPH